VVRYPKAAAFLLALNFGLGSASALPDLKFTSVLSYGSADPYQTEITTYLKPDRKRVDERRRLPQQLWYRGPTLRLPQPRFATITRCDLGRTFQLNLDDREYTSRPIPKPLSEEERKARAEQLKSRAAQGPQLQRPAQPNLLIEITTVDTGERKQMFGYTARHVVTTEKRTPLEGATQAPQQGVTDGWYTDLDSSLSCDPPRRGNTFGMLIALPRGKDERPPFPAFKFVGQRETGFALATTQRTIISSPDGPGSESLQAHEMRVTNLSSASLPLALFEIPGGFHEVSEIRRAPMMPWWARALVSLHSAWLGFERALTRLFRKLPFRG
jgi:hypothetical protein